MMVALLCLMFRGMRSAVLAVWLAVVAGLLPMAATAQTCQVPPDLMGVARTLAALPMDLSDVPSAMSDRLAQQMLSISEAQILNSLKESGLQSISPVAVDVLAEAERLAGGATFQPARVSALLRRLDEQSSLACIDSGKSIFQNGQQGRTGGFFVEKGFSWSEVSKRAEEEKLFAAGAVVFAMVGFISVLVLIDSGFRWIMALLYNRKACRIPADLKVGKKVIEGLVVTLGRGGCRFHPIDTMAFDAALADIRGTVALLLIEDEDFEVRCSGIYDTVTDFRFERSITIKHQRALLVHSTISPYYIRKSRDGGTKAVEGLI